MSLALVSRKAALLAPWNRNPLWRLARAVPSLDLRFADNKSLVDATTGQNLVSFTRASSGTYVDSQGVIRTATTNLLLRSEEFDNAAWTKTNANVTANAVTAPNGTLTADALIEDTANGLHRTFNGWTSVASVPYVGSFYVKAAGRTKVDAEMRTTSTAGSFTFDLLAGTVSGTVPNQTASITNVGDGWFRCSVAVSAAGVTAGASLLLIYLNNGTFNSYTGDGTSGIYIWGAQLEQSSTVGEYIPTTSTINSAPRFDHNPTTGESLGLLVEESRTNLWTYSEGLDDASWIKTSLSGTITTNQTTAPDGLNTADLYQENTNTIGRFLGKALSSTSGTSYTVTIWAKQAPGATRYAGLVLPAANFGVNVIASYTLSDAGSVTIAASGTGTSASIQQFPNGWYRCSLTSQATITISGNIQFRLSNSAANGAASYTGDGSSGLYFWGAQIEVGTFPTSYIPTTAATVTRSADVASISGSNFSSWYRQDEGTVFIEGITAPALSRFAPELAISDGGDINKVELYNYPSGYGATVRKSGETNVDPILLLAPVSGTSYKKALALKAGDFRVAAQGQQGVSANPLFIPIVNELKIGTNRLGTAAIGSTIRRLTFWPQRLSNSTLSSITQ